MKVLIVSFYYFPELGAAPSRITNMAEGLKNQGVDVDVLTCLPNYPRGKIFDGYRGRFCMKETINDIDVYHYWSYATNSKNALARIWGMCSFGLTMWAFAFKRKLIKKYDRVIIQTPPILVAFSAVLLFRGLYRKKTVLNISDLWPLSAVELGAVREGSLIHKIMCWVERYIYKHSNAIQGQSQAILNHTNDFQPQKLKFLYRNLQHDVDITIPDIERKPFKIVYAGLLGVAQNILGIVENIDFKSLGAEFHIFGGGNQTVEIEKFIKEHETGVMYHGYLDKNKMVSELVNYHASIVPLAVAIKGAVPSKIFDLLPVAVPILFCGGGEGAEIVGKYKIGVVSLPGDYTSLVNNIKSLIEMPEAKYQNLKKNCIKASKNDFSFDNQMESYYEFLQKVK